MEKPEDKEKESKAYTIGFAGSENYDLILYLAALLKAYKYRVLVIDLSEIMALTKAVCQLSETDRDEIAEVMEIKGIDYLAYQKKEDIRIKLCHPFLYHENTSYDYILADYGRNAVHPGFLLSNLKILVSDLKKHNLDSVLPYFEQEEKQPFLIIRDIVSSKIRPETLLRKEDVEKKMVFFLDFDPVDYISGLTMQYDRQFAVGKLSPRMKELLIVILNKTGLPLEKKEINTIIMRSKRGK